MESDGDHVEVGFASTAGTVGVVGFDSVNGGGVARHRAEGRGNEDEP